MLNRYFFCNVKTWLYPSTMIVLSALTVSCSDSQTQTNSSGSAAQDAAPSTLNGVWENRGYGRILDIRDNVVSDFEITSNGCWLSAEIFPHELDTLLGEVEQSSDSQAFNTKPELIADHVHAYTFSKLDHLPESCNENNIITPSVDPLVNYDVLWNTLNDYYAFFDLRDVDWNLVDTMVRHLLDQVESDEELYDIFRDMLRPLKDGHVDLIAEDAGKFWDAGTPPDWVARVFDFFEQTHPEVDLQIAFEMQAEYDNYDQFVNAVFTQYYQELATDNNKLVERYLNDLSCGANGHFCWGITIDNVGYLAIDAMANFIPDSDEQDTAQDLVAIKSLLDEAFLTLSSTDALMIDIRQNQGGQDSVSLELAGRFSKERRLVYRKQARNKNSFANQHDIFLSPTAEIAYTKPVYLLTSGGTYSAADVFALTMSGLPHVTLIGEPTGGIFADAIVKGLPNGWRFSLSTEIYSDPEGNVFEGVGIPVDHFVDYYVPDDIHAGHDTAIDFALNLNASLQSAR